MITVTEMIKHNREAMFGQWKIVREYGYPTDGHYEVMLAPNGRVHRASINGSMIWIANTRSPVDVHSALCRDDSWRELK